MLSFLGWLFLAGLGAVLWAFRGLASGLGGLGGGVDTPRASEAGGWLPTVQTWRDEDDLADPSAWDEGLTRDWGDDDPDDDDDEAWEEEDSFGGDSGYDDFDAGGYDGGGYDGGYDA